MIEYLVEQMLQERHVFEEDGRRYAELRLCEVLALLHAAPDRIVVVRGVPCIEDIEQ